MAQPVIRQGALAFVDIETTGGSQNNARVLEIGVVRVEAGRVVSTYKSLIDPDEPVPGFITKLTGITNEDIVAAPTFRDVADEVAEILDGAVFVAHNVHFDYGFLRMEFDRLGVPFRPKLLCTVKLSRRLYPEARGHKLQDLIDRFGFAAPSRHRAYDDADVLWQFFQRVQYDHDLDTVDAAIAAQLGLASLPSHLDREVVDALPDAPGVYIFEDETGAPLYVGKSVTLRSRVLSHFAAYHERAVERSISRSIRGVRTIRTHGELGALLTESALVKELQPLHNRQLRRRERVTLALRHRDTDGYARLSLQDADGIDPRAADDIMCVFTTSGRARMSLVTTTRNYYLCPKLMNLEKTRSGCFAVQLKKCYGACLGEENPEAYNARFEQAFADSRMHGWPYAGPVLITEAHRELGGKEGFLVDQWCLLARITEDADGGVNLTRPGDGFDLDMYKILRRYVDEPKHRRSIRTLTPAAADELLESVGAAA